VTRIVIVGGSDAGISAALRARELDPTGTVDVIVADAYPNFSICGIPYHISGDVPDWRRLAHRSIADLEATSMHLHLDSVAHGIDVQDHRLVVTAPDGERTFAYDKLVIGTGAVSVRPPIGGLDDGDLDGVHLLHSMGDTFELMRTLTEHAPKTALIVGAGYIGLEMAEALCARGLRVTQMEQLAQVLPTVDPELGSRVHAELTRHGVEVLTSTTVTEIRRSEPTGRGRWRVKAVDAGGASQTRTFDLVLVVVGVRPDSNLASEAGATLGTKGAIAVDRQMRTSLQDIYAAGDCVVTHHQLLGESYLPLGTTAHKQGRIAGENAVGGTREYAGSLGTQVVKIFDQAAARTGLRDHEAAIAGFDPFTVESEADDHKAYYPRSHRIDIRFTGDKRTGRLLGLQLLGHHDAQIAKRIDIAATAIHHGMTIDALNDLDLSYTPPLGSPWDAVQHGAQAWEKLRRSSLPPGSGPDR
jgi:NADPH-dependent 2,4-dienoyl-CoA reductase/sulfur reductase-like enzyme